MLTDQNWVEALNINPEMLAEWSANVPSGKPILVWCLEQELVSSAEYFSWASKQFGLPLLDRAFFESSLNSELILEAKGSGQWSPWTYPVEVWDGLTIIACVEPPPENERGNNLYVLAHPSAMNEAWGSTATGISALPPVPVEELHATLPAEMPVGLTAEPQPFKLNLDASVFNHEPEESTEAAAPATVAVAPPPIVKPAAAPPKLESGKEIEELLTTLCSRYKSALIMRCEAGKARPQVWSSEITVANPAGAEVNLSYATFLRIVAKTGMPYHGYLVESPAHTEFFEAIGQNDLPLNVTAVPVKKNGKLWAIVVALGDESTQKIESLHFVQENVDDCFLAIGETAIKAS